MVEKYENIRDNKKSAKEPVISGDKELIDALMKKKAK